MNIWDILGIIAGIALLISFGIGKNAIWGGVILGFIIGAIIVLINGNGWDWYLIRKAVTISVLVGAFLEIFTRLFSKERRIKRIAAERVKKQMEEEDLKRGL